MALTKEIDIGGLNILPNGVCEVRWDTIIKEDGTEIMRRYNRKVFEVAQDMTGELQWLQNVTAAAWTPAIEAKRLAELNAIAAEQEEPVVYASMADYHAGISTPL